jgi:hypothetical protein
MAVSSTSFKPGQSGNPNGYPKAAAEVQALARTYTAKAVRTLGRIMLAKTSGNRDRIAAAVALLDRAWGKPAPSDLIERIERLEQAVRSGHANGAANGNGRQG